MISIVVLTRNGQFFVYVIIAFNGRNDGKNNGDGWNKMQKKKRRGLDAKTNFTVNLKTEKKMKQCKKQMK